jgi:hypothetical protein
MESGTGSTDPAIGVGSAAASLGLNNDVWYYGFALIIANTRES